jgi:hypothetical protein
MLDAFTNPRNRKRTFMLLGISGLLGIAAAVTGINDNLPGILSAFLAITAFILAFAHPWRTSRQFMRLLIASIVGIFVFGAIMIACDILGSKLQGSGLISGLLSFGSTISLIVVLVCPSGIVVGAVGAVVTAVRSRRKPPK